MGALFLYQFGLTTLSDTRRAGELQAGIEEEGIKKGRIEGEIKG
jgi:hypothetical protein